MLQQLLSQGTLSTEEELLSLDLLIQIVQKDVTKANEAVKDAT